jgi:hypothetical protein
MISFYRIRDHLEAIGCEPKGSIERGCKFLCPAHEDHNASAKLDYDPMNHKCLVTCYAGCAFADVAAGARLEAKDFFDEDPSLPLRSTALVTRPPSTPAVRPRVVERYDYVDADGRLVFQVERMEPKGFRQRRPDGEGGWIYKMGDTQRVLYRLPAVLDAAFLGERILIVEGEKDVHTLEGRGFVATTSPAGAGKWKPEYSEALRGARVAIIADDDPPIDRGPQQGKSPGHEHARAVAAAIADIAAEVKILRCTKGKDITDHLDAGGKLSELVPLDAPRSELLLPAAPRLRVMYAEEVMALPTPGEEAHLLGDLVYIGHRLILAAETGAGKALDLDTAIPTPAGWRTMRDLQLGDVVFGSDGRPASIVATSPVMVDHECFEVEFSDGARIVADAEHLWTVHDHAARFSARRREQYVGAVGPTAAYGSSQEHRWVHPKTVTTRELRALVASEKRRLSIPVAGPIERPGVEVPIDPYLLGLWLGDGSKDNANMTAHIDDAGFFMAQAVAAGERCGPMRPIRAQPSTVNYTLGITGSTTHRCVRGHWRPRKDYCPTCRHMTHVDGKVEPVLSIHARLRNLGILGAKRIPELYQLGSISQRLSLLQGIVDSDGTVRPGGSVEVSLSDRELANDVLELARSLGLKVGHGSAIATLYGVPKRRRYRMRWTSTLPVARLPRKAVRLPKTVTTAASHRYIMAVRPVESRPVKCIGVDTKDHLYLAGREHIPTHNTSCALQMAASIVYATEFLDFKGRGNAKVLLVDVEQGTRSVQRAFRQSGLADAGSSIGLIHEPNGLRIDKDEGARKDLESVFASREFDLVILDPAYNLFTGSQTDEESVRWLMSLIDDWRREYNTAVLIPMHVRKTPTGAKFSMDEIYGSKAYTWGAESILGLRRLGDGAADLHFWKDREGGLTEAGAGVGKRWPLLFDAEAGFRKDPRGERKESTRDRVRELLAGRPGMTEDDLWFALGGAGEAPKHGTIRRALEELQCVHDGAATKKARHWELPAALPGMEIPPARPVEPDYDHPRSYVPPEGRLLG